MLSYSFYHVRFSKKTAVYELGSGSHQSASILILDFPSSRTINAFCLSQPVYGYNSQNVCYSSPNG